MSSIRSERENLIALNRRLVKDDLRWVKLFEHLNIQDVTEEEIDHAVDQE